jgi:hypothetical protein
VYVVHLIRRKLGIRIGQKQRVGVDLREMAWSESVRSTTVVADLPPFPHAFMLDKPATVD